MPTTDTKLTSLIVNKLTRTQYDTAVKDSNQLYVCTDTHEVYLGTTSLGINYSPIIDAKIQLVEQLPAQPVEGTLYGIAED